jgi:Glutathione-dependent formaldehyde-activating enzyme
VELLAGDPQPVDVPRDDGSSQRIYRCPACQVAVFSEYGHPGFRFVRAGTLDDPAGVAPDVHIFTRSKVPWVTLPDSVPAFEVYYAYSGPRSHPETAWLRGSLLSGVRSMPLSCTPRAGNGCDHQRRLAARVQRRLAGASSTTACRLCEHEVVPSHLHADPSAQQRSPPDTATRPTTNHRNGVAAVERATGSPAATTAISSSGRGHSSARKLSDLADRAWRVADEPQDLLPARLGECP